MSGVWKRGHGGTSKAPPDERGGNRYVLPNATAPHLDSTIRVGLAAYRRLPLYPYKQTSLPCVGMSQMCQHRTLTPPAVCREIDIDNAKDVTQALCRRP